MIWTSEAIEGSIETILELKKKGKKVVLVTNSSMKSRAAYSRKISAMGCDIEVDNINTSGMSCTALTNYASQLHHSNSNCILSFVLWVYNGRL